MKLLTHRTEITRGTNAKQWQLRLYFQMDTRLPTLGKVRLGLDTTMVAEPTTVQGGAQVSVSPSGLGFNLTELPFVVSENGREITVPLRILRFAGPTRHVVAIQIEFRWTTGLREPDRVTLHVQAFNCWSRTLLTEDLVGYNVGSYHPLRAKLLKFLRRQRESDFYFPSDESILRVDFSILSPELPRILTHPGTRAWAVTWPHEVQYWKSSDALWYLAVQVNRLRSSRGREQPIRIGVCPILLGVELVLVRAFWASLEVQSRCGLEVLMVSPEHLSDLLRTENRGLSVFGSSVGMYFDNIYDGIEHEVGELMFGREQIENVDRQYRDLYARAEPWHKYKSRIPVEFSHREEGRLQEAREVVEQAVLVLDKHPSFGA